MKRLLLLLGPLLAGPAFPHLLPTARGDGPVPARLRRPVTLVALDGWLLTANQRSGTVSVIDTRQKTVIGEVPVAAALSDLKPVGDGRWLLAVSEREHRLIVLRRQDETLEVVDSMPVARHPVSIAVSADANRCTVASLWSRRLTILDLEPEAGDSVLRVTSPRVIDLPFAPRSQLLLPGDARVLVADAFGGRLAIVDLDEARVERLLSIPGHNIRGLALSSDGRELLVAHQLLNGQESTTRDNVFWGGVMLNVLRSIRLDELLAGDEDSLLIGTLLPLGYPSNATGDPSGLVVTSTGRTVVTLGGVDEVAVRTDPIRPFRHQSVGRRPTALAAKPDEDTVYVANTLDDTISVLTGGTLEVADTIPLGPQPEAGPADRGEALFYSARLSLDGWFSCHSCHTDGHTNGLLSDNLGDGHFGAPKRVLSLLGAAHSGPWAWNGQSQTLSSQIRKSIVDTMRGEEPDDVTVRSLEAFLTTLVPPPGLAVARATDDAPRVRRGRELFGTLGCGDCHSPPAYTSPAVYDVGLNDGLGTQEFNPPSLRGVSQGGPYFHDSRAADLRSVFTQFGHGLGERQLSPDELDSLLDFLERL